MIVVDTGVWIDHLRSGVSGLTDLLQRGEVLGHPWVIGELAMGNLANRREVLGLLAQLPEARIATDVELLAFVERHELSGIGIGWVDAQLLAATALSDDARLWTHDRRLHGAADRLDLAASAP